MENGSNPLRNYILYLLQRVFDRKKPPLEWKVLGDKDKIRIWQYQVELEGGERYGPSFNHESEAMTFMEKFSPEMVRRVPHIIRYWTYASKEKYRYVEPELVGQ